MACATWSTSAEIVQRLLDGSLPGCFSPGVMTFARLARQILESAPVRIRPIDPLMKRQLVRRFLDEQLAAGRLRHFRSIAATSGLVDLVSHGSAR